MNEQAVQRTSRHHRENTERLSALETGLGETNKAVERLADSVRRGHEELRDSIQALGREFAVSRRPDWQLLISGAGLMLLLFAAGMTPLWVTIGYLRDDVRDAKDWQTAYTRGQVPSSAEPKLAAMDKQFAEVETQFKAFQNTVGANDRYTRERADMNAGHIEQLQQESLRAREGWGRLDERLKALEHRP